MKRTLGFVLASTLLWASSLAPSPALALGDAQALGTGPIALPFFALPPCRLVDTRGNAPLTGGFLPAATVRSYALTGVCNVPANAQAVSLNATVVRPVGPGFLTLWPEGGAFPSATTLNYVGGDIVANAAVVPVSAAGGISMALGVSGGDVILDTNGYYASGRERHRDGNRAGQRHGFGCRQRLSCRARAFPQTR